MKFFTKYNPIILSLIGLIFFVWFHFENENRINEIAKIYELIGVKVNERIVLKKDLSITLEASKILGENHEIQDQIVKNIKNGIKVNTIELQTLKKKLRTMPKPFYYTRRLYH